MVSWRASFIGRRCRIARTAGGLLLMTYGQLPTGEALCSRVWGGRVRVSLRACGVVTCRTPADRHLRKHCRPPRSDFSDRAACGASLGSAGCLCGAGAVVGRSRLVVTASASVRLVSGCPLSQSRARATNSVRGGISVGAARMQRVGLHFYCVRCFRSPSTMRHRPRTRGAGLAPAASRTCFLLR